GELDIQSGGAAIHALVLGLEVVSAGGSDIDASVFSGGGQKVLAGGTVVGATISGGGTQYVYAGGFANATAVGGSLVDYGTVSGAV
ncbi:hypothetical protein ABTJ50_21300, partial [Acinetobacter baumannii]